MRRKHATLTFCLRVFIVAVLVRTLNEYLLVGTHHRSPLDDQDLEGIICMV